MADLSVHYLGDIWDQMGLASEARQQRRDVVDKTLTAALLRMRRQEQARLNELIDDIEAFGKERARLAKVLQSFSNRH